MMYNSKLVVAVKANGRILREHQDAVYVPFGAEYTLMFKNLNTVRALVNLEIDGERMTAGGLVLNPGETIDLERSIKEGNLSSGNKFKFIERTAQVEAGPRGIKAEDGLLRVLFEFERAWQPPVTSIFTQTTSYPNNPRDLWYVTTNSALRSAGTASIANSVRDVHDGVACSSSYMGQEPTVGITVPGAISEQAFSYAASVFSDGVKHVLILRLLGEVAGAPVKHAVTVKHKPKCVTCGTVNKGGSKFCSACGTSLIIA